MSLVAESQVAESQLADDAQLQRASLQRARSQSREAVPVIDISGYFTGSAAEKQRVAREIGEACRTIGFLLVTGHGVPNELDRAHRGTGRAFFDLPEAVKRRFGAPDPNIYRGYYAVETNAVAYSRDDRVGGARLSRAFLDQSGDDRPEPTPITPRRWAGAFSRRISGRRKFPSCAKRGPNTTTPWRSSRQPHAPIRAGARS